MGTLHSIDAEDVSAKVAPLTGLNGSGADGALIQPLRLAPLTASATGEPGGLWHYMVQRRRGPASPEAVLLGEAARSTSAEMFRSIYRDIAASLASFAALTTRLDALCGDETPPSSTIRNTLIEAQDALRDFSGVDFSQVDTQPVAQAEAEAPVVATAAPGGGRRSAACRSRPAAYARGRVAGAGADRNVFS